ncbi:hypothetical protein BLA24064_00599 [Burkholderia latens]|uniref:Uncharacterized protein n=1 Tax=Burkholderia latens TaxID=488446 RepID=A0A6P2HL49_9BURK|nr:hypothetical protein BLA24064_00599 [Burkholderia latens]
MYPGRCFRDGCIRGLIRGADIRGGSVASGGSSSVPGRRGDRRSPIRCLFASVECHIRCKEVDQRQNACHGAFDRDPRRIQHHVRMKRTFIGRRDAGKVPNLAPGSPRVEAFRISSYALLQRSAYIYFDEPRANDRPCERPLGCEGRDGCHDRHVMLIIEKLRYMSDTSNVFVAVCHGKSEIGADSRPQFVAVERDRPFAVRFERCAQRASDCRLSSARQPSQPKDRWNSVAFVRIVRVHMQICGGHDACTVSACCRNCQSAGRRKDFLTASESAWSIDPAFCGSERRNDRPGAFERIVGLPRKCRVFRVCRRYRVDIRNRDGATEEMRRRRFDALL